MNYDVEVAVVGGGPAGAYCALQLAQRGICATVFDPSHPREKVCGGGVAAFTIKKFPFLEQFRQYGGSPKGLKLISCTDRTLEVEGDGGFHISRRILDQGILDLALNAGCKLVTERVLSMDKVADTWAITTSKRVLTARMVVGADGVQSVVRAKTVGPISALNLAGSNVTDVGLDEVLFYEGFVEEVLDGSVHVAVVVRSHDFFCKLGEK